MSECIVVFGVGFMGFVVVYQLVCDGYQFVVFEVDDCVGGMIVSFDFGGMLIECYYYFYCIFDYDFLVVFDELGLGECMCWIEICMGYWFGKCLQLWGNLIVLLCFRGLGLMVKICYGLYVFVCMCCNDWCLLDYVEVLFWICCWVGVEVYEMLWCWLFDYKFYDYVGNLFVVWIWSWIWCIGCFCYSLMCEKFGYLEGGLFILFDVLYVDIQCYGGEVWLFSLV